MRHVVNIALLCMFTTLLVTGIMVFFLPFSLLTTRVHVVSGLIVSTLVACHLATRLQYFQKAFGARIRGLSKVRLAISLSLSAGFTALAIWGVPPLSWMLSQSYESRHRAQIFRASPLVGFGQPSPHSQVIVRTSDDTGSGDLSVLLSFRKSLKALPAIAVWAESTTGTMIETLYLSPELAYREQADWRGTAAARSEVLPIWRHRYSVISQVAPDGQADVVSGATEKHEFALDRYLLPGKANRFVLCVEINTAHDPNDTWTDPELGQPSLLYTALVDVDRDPPHALLELTGHGGDAEAATGAVQYNLESITTAKKDADLFLVKLDDPSG